MKRSLLMFLLMISWCYVCLAEEVQTQGTQEPQSTQQSQEQQGQYVQTQETQPQENTEAMGGEPQSTVIQEPFGIEHQGERHGEGCNCPHCRGEGHGHGCKRGMRHHHFSESGPDTHEGFIPSVSTNYGSLTLLGVFQALASFSVIGTNFNDNSNFDFNLQRARIILKGHVVSENLQYFFQGDAVNSDTSFVLDAALTYNVPSWKLSFRIGRFVPDFSIMMPRNTADLGTINYPIYLTDGNFAFWRQIGFQFTYSPVSLMNITLGVFNGMAIEPSAFNRYPRQFTNGARMYMGLITSYSDPDTPNNVVMSGYNNYKDNNLYKDILLRINFNLFDGFTLGLHNWLSFPRSYSVRPDNPDNPTRIVFDSWSSDRDTFDTVYQGGISLEYRKNNLHLAGEFMFGYIKFASSMDTAYDHFGDPSYQIDSLMRIAFWLHAGYLLWNWFEPTIRVEWMDPALSNEYDNDQVVRVTVGPNFWLEEGNHFRILANYFVDYYYQDDTRDPVHNFQVQFQALW